jgi:X-X-X-Leu-X-X-Gly heptad repeat protein
MARKKHHKKAAHKRRKSSRRGMAGAGSMIKDTAALIIGGVAAQFAAKYINGMSNLSDGTKKIAAGAAPLALGLALPKFAKSPLFKSIGTGMVVVGGVNLIKDNAKGALGALMPTVAGYRSRMALAPSMQNTRGAIAGTGLTTQKAAILSA